MFNTILYPTQHIVFQDLVSLFLFFFLHPKGKNCSSILCILCFLAIPEGLHLNCQLAKSELVHFPFYLQVTEISCEDHFLQIYKIQCIESVLKLIIRTIYRYLKKNSFSLLGFCLLPDSLYFCLCLCPANYYLQLIKRLHSLERSCDCLASEGEQRTLRLLQN